MTRKYFGTDGIRGRVGDAPVTPDFMLKLGWATGKVFAATDGSRPTVVIGKDTRVSGYMLESALQAGLVAAGANVKLVGPLPTPGIALLTRSQKADAGIVISASHNPYYDNGIKFFNGQGSKLSDELELQIEAMIDSPMETVDSDQLGKASRIADAAGRYIEYCKSTFPDELSLKGLKIVIDCAHGATYNIAPGVFSELGADVTLMGAEPDGYNINEGVGSTEPEALQQRVMEEGADLGVAFDGDGDRLQMVNREGQLLTGDDVLYILAMHRLSTGGSDSGVVGTLMTNMGLELALEQSGLRLARAKVGDRYVKELMVAEGWSLGGESSGHIICGNLSTTGDGVIAALQVLAAVVASGRSLSQLTSGFTPLPQVLVNVRIKKGFDIAAHQAINDACERVEQALIGRGRLLLRPSGTEPVIRVMVEGDETVAIDALANEVAEAIRQAA
ncbi:phosphoglucosamine mutase [Candidatus Paraluminiphilus aquimaris]|uniref:Phosphoglucosamine mutase n=1 Tax=Candidatus Paraluminiphilus aquimaris TaxID=2518994 RepID=A0ABY6Q3C2_9GAMM|nr:phosphoglucosamine mutase [Candidatus Paraluminiphilus aquimaris]UZP73281.1 phosphoglucosamine mutase [Candidatus Paraluminiphilus aquimaris]